MLVWVLQKAGAKAGVDTKDFLRGDGRGMKCEGIPERQASCKSDPS